MRMKVMKAEAIMETDFNMYIFLNEKLFFFKMYNNNKINENS